MLTNPIARAGLPVAALGAVLAVALWAPVPHLGNPGTNQVVAAVEQRLPGWRLVSATTTWEGGYAVVASCGTSQIGFQVIPGHGLPIHDAWVQPNDAFSRIRLSEVSDYPGYLIWRAVPVLPRTFSCRDELAREAETARPAPASVTSTSLRAGDGLIEEGRRPVD